MKKKIFLLLIVILIGIQFIRPEKNLSTHVFATDISNVYATPQSVSVILKKACRDCHSNNTVYPWYAEVQPVGLWLNNHVHEGKRELNLNEFGSYPVARQYKKLDDMIDEVREGEMPIGSYALIHTDARLTDEEKQTFIRWCEDTRDTIRSKYPPDSLIMKKRGN
jgi:hypothetical protein